MLLRLSMLIMPLAVLLSVAYAYSGDAFEVCRLDPNGDNFLALRAGPGSSHAIIMKLGPGSVVEARGDPKGNWLAVVVESANGKTYLRDLPSGFVYTKYLCSF